MGLAACYSGHTVTRAFWSYGPGVSSFSLDFRLSTVNSDCSTQSPCFHDLLHFSATSQKSPLCFHNLTNPFSRSPFVLITIQIARGVGPLATKLSEPIHEPRATNSTTANHFLEPPASSTALPFPPSASCFLFILRKPWAAEGPTALCFPCPASRNLLRIASQQPRSRGFVADFDREGFR